MTNGSTQNRSAVVFSVAGVILSIVAIWFSVQTATAARKQFIAEQRIKAYAGLMETHVFDETQWEKFKDYKHWQDTVVKAFNVVRIVAPEDTVKVVKEMVDGVHAPPNGVYKGLNDTTNRILEKFREDITEWDTR